MKRAADWTGADVREIADALFGILKWCSVVCVAEGTVRQEEAENDLRKWGIHVDLDADKVESLNDDLAISLAYELINWLRSVSRPDYHMVKHYERELVLFGITIRYEETEAV